MSIDPSEAEGILEPPVDHDNDVTADKPDPKETYAAFEAKHVAWKASPSDLTWHEFRRTYRDLKSSLPDAVLDALWKEKRDPHLQALRDYGLEAERRYAKSPARKRSKNKYDRRNALTEHRKEQCRKARRAYKERQRAEKTATSETSKKTSKKKTARKEAKS